MEKLSRWEGSSLELSVCDYSGCLGCAASGKAELPVSLVELYQEP
jgi:hypothetical protein